MYKVKEIPNHYQPYKEQPYEGEYAVPVVVPNLAPSIKAQMLRQQQGLPINTTSRVIETYYRNMDLTDIQKASEAYKIIQKKIADNKNAINQAKEKLEKQKQETMIKFQKFLETQQKNQQI